MIPRWRIVTGIVGLVLILASATPLVWPALLKPAPISGRSAAIASLPQPKIIISPGNFPSPLPMGDQQLSRDPPVSPDGWVIRIPQLNIVLPIVQGDGQSVPYYKAAHYPTTAWPGDGGRSFVYAHAQYGPPIMFGPLLDHGRTGLDVYVDRPGQGRLHYVVQQFYPAWSAYDTTWLRPTNHEELVLMTCTSWNSADPRVLAVAEPAP